MRRETSDASGGMRCETLDTAHVVRLKSKASCLMSNVSCQSDSSPIMLSALQHYLFCPRQCALIHVEGAWHENYLTAAGRILHERVDRKGAETRKGVHLATALRLSSTRLGLIGVADMVEFYKVDAPEDESGNIVASTLPGRAGYWRPFPVEYKKGKPKAHQADEVQLCAQAMCLEEMLQVRIASGALFYGETRHRVEVVFDGYLRGLTEDVVARTRELLASGQTPAPDFTKACRSCSLYEICRPECFDSRLSAKRWIDNQVGMCVG